MLSLIIVARNPFRRVLSNDELQETLGGARMIGQDNIAYLAGIGRRQRLLVYHSHGRDDESIPPKKTEGPPMTYRDRVGLKSPSLSIRCLRNFPQPENRAKDVLGNGQGDQRIDPIRISSRKKNDSEILLRSCSTSDDLPCISEGVDHMSP